MQPTSHKSRYLNEEGIEQRLRTPFILLKSTKIAGTHAGKGWLEIRKQGRSFHYSATVPRDVNLGQRVAEMVDKSCGGNPEKLMMALLHYRGLSEEEVARIRSMLDAARNQDKT
ncbi:MAG: BlaI/MecI/CopY family transcriptional regulator [Gammaproteobacteria bacterium]